MPDLLASCWTTAGDALPIPGRDVSPLDMIERIKQAGRAGFTGFGFVVADLERMSQDGAWARTRSALRDAGVDWIELEILQGWWKEPGPARQESDRQRQLLFDAADHLGAFRLKIAGDTEDLRRPDLDQWAAQLHDLCTHATEHGLGVAVEFLMFSNIPNLAAALDLVERADHPAAGVMIDSWHVDRSGTTPAEIAAIPLEFLGGVELDDGMSAQAGTEYEDTVNNRLYLGQGEFRNGELIAAVSAVGWTGPWGVEIISTHHRARPLSESLPEVAATTRSAFIAAGVG